MHNQLQASLSKFFHDMTLAELRLQNKISTTPQLTYNDLLYLSLISSHSGVYTASKIADMLYVSRPAVTQKINALEKMGYLRKEQCQADKRVQYLHIVDEGKHAMHAHQWEATDSNIVAQLSQKYKPQEIAVFCTMLDEIGEIFLQETPNEEKRG